MSRTIRGGSNAPVREFTRRSVRAARLRYRVMNRVADYRLVYGMIARPEVALAERSDLPAGHIATFMTVAGVQDLIADDPALVAELRPSFLDDAGERGDRCMVITVDDQLASYGWYSTSSPTPYGPGLDVHFDDASWVYMYKGYTSAAHRGKRLHAVGMESALAIVADEGYQGLISCVEATNAASLRSCHRMGYEIFGEVSACRPRLGRRSRSGWFTSRSDRCAAFDFALEESPRGAR